MLKTFRTLLTLISTLCKIFSKQNFEIIFLIVPRKQDLTFHANRLPMEMICMKCKILFSGKNKKNTTSLSSAELAQRKVKVKAGIQENLDKLQFHTYNSQCGESM